MANAILIPYNPYHRYVGGGGVGRVVPHIFHAEKAGGVFWTSAATLPIAYDTVNRGYFYATKKKRVTHACDVLRFVDFRERELTEEEWAFVPQFRYRDIEVVHEDEGYAILVKRIRRLKRLHSLSDFHKISDGLPVEAIRAPIIVLDPGYAVESFSTPSTVLVDSHLKSLFTNAGMREEDIENLFEYVLFDLGLVIERQLGIRKGRLDILVKKGDTSFVFELKRAAAIVADIKQLAQYVKRIERDEKKPVVGVLICAEYGPEITQTVKVWNSKGLKLHIASFKFSIDFGLEKFEV